MELPEGLLSPSGRKSPGGMISLAQPLAGLDGGAAWGGDARVLAGIGVGVSPTEVEEPYRLSHRYPRTGPIWSLNLSWPGTRTGPINVRPANRGFSGPGHVRLF